MPPRPPEHPCETVACVGGAYVLATTLADEHPWTELRPSYGYGHQQVLRGADTRTMTC